MKKIYYSAKDITKMLDISEASAYKIIKTLNNELVQKGFLVVNGKISKAYFHEKWYFGQQQDELQEA